MDQSSRVNKRRYFRLRYPLHLCPEIIIWDHTHQVVEISEGGIVLTTKRPGLYRPNEKVAGFIKFRDGHSLFIEGTILRKDNDLVVIMLQKLLPLERMYTEERYVLQHGGKTR